MKKALLLIDIQKDYFENGRNALIGSDVACKNAKVVLDWFRNNHLPVIHIQHVAIRSDATFFLPNTVGVEIHDLMKPIETEKVIVKHFPNSFRGTDLLKHLKLLEIKELIICGMMTHMCVDSTIRASKDLGFKCLIIGDACATKDLILAGQTISATEVQKSFLAALSYFYADIITTHDYLMKNQ